MTSDQTLSTCLVSTGEEVLRGEIADGNNRFLATTLGEQGFTIEMMMTAGDRREDLLFVMRTALERANYLFISGGLGPTEDDLTAEVAAELAGVERFFDEASWEAILALFAKYKIECGENNRKQAMIPIGATVLANPNGTAPGFSLSFTLNGQTKTIVALPGPPRELQPMVHTFLAERQGEVVAQRDDLFIRFLGLGESTLAERLEPWTRQWGEVSFRQAFPEMEVKLYRPDPERAAALCQFAEEHLGDYLLDYSAQSTAELFTTFMQQGSAKLAFAESCTGGLAAKTVTDVAGSSDYFLGGVVSYANAVKENFLDVAAQTLNDEGAVSEAVAQQMAEGALARFSADISLSFTGVAGPGGGTEEKPVGMVWMAKSSAAGTQTKCLHLILDREHIRLGAVYHGLRWLMEDWLSGYRNSKENSQ